MVTQRNINLKVLAEETEHRVHLRKRLHQESQDEVDRKRQCLEHHQQHGHQSNIDQMDNWGENPTLEEYAYINEGRVQKHADYHNQTLHNHNEVPRLGHNFHSQASFQTKDQKCNMQLVSSSDGNQDKESLESDGEIYHAYQCHTINSSINSDIQGMSHIFQDSHVQNPNQSQHNHIHQIPSGSPDNIPNIIHNQTENNIHTTYTDHLTPSLDVQELEKEKKSMEDRLEDLKSMRRCVVCLDAEYGAVFLPCLHLVTCSSCAVTLPQCPVCRATTQCAIPVYFEEKHEVG